MAFIGNTPTTQAFTPAVDYFSGNGSTTAFTLSRPVASVAQVQVTIDNVAQNPSSAYTVSNNTITFTSAPLSGTNNIYVYYTSPITQVIAPGQGTVTTTSLTTNFTLPVANGGTGLTAVPHTVTVYTSGSGTYTTPTNCKAIFVQCWGGGGSGGGGNGSSARGTGGGAGGYSQKLIASPSATYSYAVGAGGTAAAQSANGTTGGTTTFGTSLLTCNGGVGGTAASGGAVAGSSGGAASGGDLNISGGESPTLNLQTNASSGGDSPLGGGGGKVNVTQPGTAPGGGGANANYTGSSGAGATGTILITEFYV